MIFSEVDSSSNEAIVYVVLRNLDLNFPGQTYQVSYLTKAGKVNITIAMHKTEDMHLSSNGTTANIIYIMTLYYIVKVTKFEM